MTIVRLRPLAFDSGCVVVAATLLGGAPADAGVELVSSNATGVKQNQDCLGRPRVSDDGRFVLFSSTADNLGYDPIGAQIYVKDTSTGSVELISRTAGGTTSWGTSYAGDITPDGRFVVFHSSADDLAAAGSPAFYDVYRFDRQTGTMLRISLGSLADGFGSTAATLSHDGNKVLFLSTASDLVPGDTNGVADVFLHDVTAGVTTRVNVSSAGAEDTAACGSASFSADGRFVVFECWSSWVPQDQNPSRDVYLKDLQTGALSVVNVNPAGLATAVAGYPLISADGQSVAFQSSASDLVFPDINGFADVFVRRLATGTTLRVSSSSLPMIWGANAASIPDAISSDGRYVAFQTTATNLSLADLNPFSHSQVDLFVRDTLGQRTAPISVKPDGSTPTGYSALASFSSDGLAIVFASNSSQLIAGDTTFESSDVFLTRDVGFFEAGGALAGSAGKPRLRGIGSLHPGSMNTLTLSQAASGAAALLLYGGSYNQTTIHGGTLLLGPTPFFTFPLVTDGLGGFTVPFSMPVQPVAAGAVTLQVLIADGGAPQNVAFSNGIFAFVP